MAWSEFYIGNPLFDADGKEIGYTKFNEVQYPGAPFMLYDTQHKLLGRYADSIDAVKVLASREGISAKSIYLLGVGDKRLPAVSEEHWESQARREERDRQTILATGKAVTATNKAHSAVQEAQGTMAQRYTVRYELAGRDAPAFKAFDDKLDAQLFIRELREKHGRRLKATQLQPHAPKPSAANLVPAASDKRRRRPSAPLTQESINKPRR